MGGGGGYNSTLFPEWTLYRGGGGEDNWGNTVFHACENTSQTRWLFISFILVLHTCTCACVFENNSAVQLYRKHFFRYS